MAEETPSEIQKTMFRHDRTMKASPIDVSITITAASC
jgi:hypothetical protein